jgi:hypothetical protein
VELRTIKANEDGSVFAGGTDCTLLVRERGAWGGFEPAVPCTEAGQPIRSLWSSSSDRLHVLAGVFDVHDFDDGQWHYQDSRGSTNGEFGSPETLFRYSGEGTVDRLFGVSERDVFLVGSWIGHFDGEHWGLMSQPGESGVVLSLPNVAGLSGDEARLHVVRVDGRISILTRLWPWSCEASEDDCGNGMDDDCDGFFDADDEECVQQ